MDFGGNDADGRGFVEEANNCNVAVFLDLPFEVGRRIRRRLRGDFVKFCHCRRFPMSTGTLLTISVDIGAFANLGQDDVLHDVAF